MPPTRQRPGITFRTETPALVELPRMDIAAFVGFAQRGPIDTPVPIESYPDFVDIFGGNYRLAWDEVTAIWQTACLAPAVKAFFTQGGRRCWIVRVASTRAVSNRFVLSGLLQTEVSGYGSVVAVARSVGSWSDTLQVGAELQLEPMSAIATAVQPGTEFALTIRQGISLQAGDLLQLDFTDGIHRAYLVVEESRRSNLPTTPILANPRRTYWFRKVTANNGVLTGTVQTVAPAPLVSDTATLNSEKMTLETNLATFTTGDWLRLHTPDEHLWLKVGQIQGGEIQITSPWLEGAATNGQALSLARALRVQIALQIREEPEQYRSLTNLACAAPHPRFIGYLPDDARLFAPHFGQPDNQQNQASPLWQEVKQPRFPLSMSVSRDTVVIPLGLETGVLPQGVLTNNEESLVRDGLVPSTTDYSVITGAAWSNFFGDLFLDPQLRNTGVRSLITEASDRLYLQGEQLTGLHSLFPVEEISLIALPDVAHRGWVLTQRQTAEPEPEPPPPKPDDPCAKKNSPFTPCVTEFSDSEEPKPQPAIEAREPTLWKLLPVLEYDAQGLLTVQLAAAKLAAARGDMVAVLGLPKHYRPPDALQYQRQLATELWLASDTADSYVALYHPWLVTREETGDLLHTHPAGSVCGVIAARSLSRGAWVAPANEVVQGTLATLPPLALTDDLAFYQAGINPIREEARGFVLWGEYTQSTDSELENLNVRRLLILLRRIALVEGQNYVFAPHSPAFRRRVQQQFEQRLARLFAQGAFAGLTPAAAYRVVIDETVNTSVSVEQGRLVVELRVAPSQPLAFITVRLVELSNGLLTTQEVIRNGS